MTLKALKCLVVSAVCVCALSATAQIVVPQSSVRNLANPRIAHTNYLIYKGPWRHGHVGTLNRTTASIQGYHPADIRAAYNLPATGGSEAIAVIDAHDLPTSLHDFNVFSSAFGLPQETSTDATASSNKVFQVVYATGTKPSADGSWGGEIAIDMEWSHAVAPNAKIYVIECASSDFTDLLVGVQKAAQLADVREVSMSFGSSESSDELTEDSNFTATNQVYFAAAGDTSNELDYPAASPNVIGVGGTSLNVSPTVTETAWATGGGGPSIYEPRPTYQNGFTTTNRGTPDVSADADPQTGCAVYDSTPIPHSGSGWVVYGGTSLATPIIAGITNLRGDFATSSYAELTHQYSLAGTSYFRDIVSGTSGHYTAAPGYDFITGLGSMTNVFPSVNYAPATLTVLSGTPVGGIPDNVIALDNHDYILRSVPVTSTQQQVLVSGTFSTSLNLGASRIGATFSVTGMCLSSSTTFSLFNFNRMAWDVISPLSLGSTNSSSAVSILNFANYFDSSGNVQFQITSQNQSSSPPVFRLGLDQIQLRVTTSS